MKLRYIVPIISVPLILACGTGAAVVIAPPATVRPAKIVPAIATQTPANAPETPKATQTTVPMISVVSSVLTVRDEYGRAIGWLRQGERVKAVCLDELCQIVEGQYCGGYIWRGCTSDPAGYGCK